MHEELEMRGLRTRIAMWAVVLAWFAIAVLLTGLLVTLMDADPERAGVQVADTSSAFPGLLVLGVFLVTLVVGPLITWRWIRRHHLR